jgi:hypothetical protein
VKLDEVSAKVSYGPPDDEVEDLELPIWAGEIPLHTVVGTPIADPGVPDGIQPPASVSRYARAFGATGPQ